MTNIDFIAHQKGGVNHITLTPSHKPEKARFSIIDGALLVGFLAAFMGLVFLLSE